MAHAQFAQVNRQNLQVQERGTKASIPSDPIARLMYYLKCVEDVECGNFPSYMTDYKNYRKLSQNQRNNIIATASRNEPDDVLCFVEADELPDNDGNKFLRLSAQQESLTAFGIQGGGQAMTGLRRQLGNKQKLVDIMAHTNSWAQSNYYRPLKQLTEDSDSDDSDSAAAALGMLMMFRALQM